MYGYNMTHVLNGAEGLTQVQQLRWDMLQHHLPGRSPLEGDVPMNGFLADLSVDLATGAGEIELTGYRRFDILRGQLDTTGDVATREIILPGRYAGMTLAWGREETAAIPRQAGDQPAEVVPIVGDLKRGELLDRGQVSSLRLAGNGVAVATRIATAAEVQDMVSFAATLAGLSSTERARLLATSSVAARTIGNRIHRTPKEFFQHIVATAGRMSAGSVHVSL